MKVCDGLILLSGAALALTLALTGCDQAQQPERPSASLGTGVQASPWIDPACHVEGHLVALECNELAAWPTCPAEDEPMHAGQPCFWADPDGRGLLWSDGQSNE